MANCVYTLRDENGKEFSIEGIPALKAYLVDGGLEQLFPERELPRTVAEILGRQEQPRFSVRNDTDGGSAVEKGPFDLSLPRDANKIRETKIGDTKIVLDARPDKIIISSVRTPIAKRGRGSARNAMQALVKQADDEGVILELGASPLDKKTITNKLVDFYKSFGFTLTGRSINPLGDPEMVREPQQRDARYSFAGQKAQTANLESLSQAQARLAKGENPESVRQDTGWYVGEDGAPRFEISDHDSRIQLTFFGGLTKFLQEYQRPTVGDFLQHPRLFEAYPELADYPVIFLPSSDIGGHGGIIGNRIYLAADQSRAEMRSVLIHELQHAIQNIEGFATGGTSAVVTQDNYRAYQKEMLQVLEKDLQRYEREGNKRLLDKVKAQIRTVKAAADYDAYKRLAGEVEARNAQKRLNYSEKDRQKVAPERTAEFRGNDIIVKFGNTSALDAKGNVDLSRFLPSNRDKAFFTNQQEAIDYLSQSFGPGIQTLIDQGVLQFTQGKSAWPQSTRNTNAEAVYLNGKTILIDLNATNRERLNSVMLHELGEHYNLKRMIGAEAYGDLMNAVRNRAAIQGSEAWKVWQRVKNTPEYANLEEGSEAFVSEVIAKLGETNPNLPWYRRLLAQIKSFLLRMGLARGITAGSITEADIHQLLVTSLRSAIARAQQNAEPRVYGQNADVKFSAQPATSEEQEILDRPTNIVPESEYEDIHKSWMKAIKEKLENGSDALFKKRFALNTVSQIVELSQWMMPGLKAYDDYNEKLKATRNNWYRLADRLVSGNWSKLEKPDERLLARVVQSSTLADVDASKPWRYIVEVEPVNDKNIVPDAPIGPGRGTGAKQYKVATQARFTARYQKLLAQAAKTAGAARTVSSGAVFNTRAEAESFMNAIKGIENQQIRELPPSEALDSNEVRYSDYQTLLPMYNKLSNEAKAIYAESNAMLNSVYHAKLNVLAEQVSEAVMTAKAKSELIARMRQNFESRSLNNYYAPLNRYGDYWFYGQTAEGRVYFRTYENEKAREKGVDSFLKAGGKIDGKGKNLSDLVNTVSGDLNDSFMADIQRIIAEELEQSTAEQKKQVEELQDRINQFYLSALPEISMRHHMQHREGILGFSTDVRQNFANTMHHQAAQLANMMYGKKMRKVLEDHNTAKEIASSGPRKENAEMDLEALRTLKANWSKYVAADVLADKLKAAEAADDKKAIALYKAALSLRNKMDSADDETAVWVKKEKILTDKRKAQADTLKAFDTLMADWATLGKRGELEDRIKTAVLGSKVEEEKLLRAMKLLRDKVGTKASEDNAKAVLGFLRSEKEKALSADIAATEKAAKELVDNWDSYNYKDVLARLIAQAKEQGRDRDAKLYDKMRAFRNQVGSDSTPKDAVKILANIQKDKEAIMKASTYILPKDISKATDVLNELNLSYRDNMTVGTSDMDRLATSLNQVNFIYMLGAGLSSNMVNLIQVAGFTMPKASGRFGVLKTKNAFEKAYADWFYALRHWKLDADNVISVTETFKDQLDEAVAKGDTVLADRLRFKLAAMEAYKDDGTLTRTNAMDLIGIGREGSGHNGPMTWLSKKAGWLFHHSERLNREVSLAAALDLEMDKQIKALGYPTKSKDKMAMEARAMAYAKSLTNKTHGDYDKANAARIFRGWGPQIAFQFKKYPQFTLYAWITEFAHAYQSWRGTIKREDFATQEQYDAALEEGKEARSTFLAMLAAQVTLAGALQLPFMGLIGALYTAVGGLAGDDDDPWDFERDLRVGAKNLFGSTVGEALTMGWLNQLPMDWNIAGRLDQSDIFFREPFKEDEGRDAAMQYAYQLFGPTGGTLGNIADGLHYLADGYWYRGAEKMLPKAVGDIIKTIRLGSDDARTLDDSLIKEMSPSELIGQIMGFSSASLERKYAERDFEQQAETLIEENRKKIVHEAAKAILNREPVDREAILEWNEKHPTYRITPSNVRQAARSRHRNELLRGERGYLVNPKLEYLYEENRLED